MNSLNTNIPVGSIVKVKYYGREVVCLSGFGMKKNLAGTCIVGYPKGFRKWKKEKYWISIYDDEGYYVKSVLRYRSFLVTITIDGMLIKKLIRKGWRKR